MGLARSTYYDTPATEADTEIVARITAICEEFEAYGYRRVGAELRHQGIVVNGKKIRRLMRQHDLQPKRRRRFIATTDSDHDSPIFSNRAKDVTVDRPTTWVAAHLRRNRRWLRLCRHHPRFVVTASLVTISRSIDTRLISDQGRSDDSRQGAVSTILQPRQGRYGRQAEPALGRRHHLRRNRRWLRLCRHHPRFVVTPRRWLCHQPLDRYAAHLGSAQGRCPVTTAAKGLYPPFGSRIAIRSGRLSQDARQTWADRLDEPAWQPLRERYG